MKITPAEIRQKEFERNFRGYDKDEVNAFLQTMSQEWERILEENREMRYRLDASQKEVEKLREVDSSLYKTLKTAFRSQLRDIISRQCKKLFQFCKKFLKLHILNF